MRNHHVLIDQPRRTNPLIWCIAIVCTICTAIIIITGLTVFICYLVIQPKVPSVSITYARLDMFDSSQAGVLNTQLTIWFKAENDNHDAHARFSHWVYDLSFHGIKIDRLKDRDFIVNKNDNNTITYVVKADYIPLDQHLMALVYSSIASNRIVFHIDGSTRTKWRVGPIKSVKFWLKLHCDIIFQSDGTCIDTNCSSKSK